MLLPFFLRGSRQVHHQRHAGGSVQRGEFLVSIILHKEFLKEILVMVKGVFLLAAKQSFLYGKNHQVDRFIRNCVGNYILVCLLGSLDMLPLGKVFQLHLSGYGVQAPVHTPVLRKKRSISSLSRASSSLLLPFSSAVARSTCVEYSSR